MDPKEAYYREQVEGARNRHRTAGEALAKVRELLAKADEEYRRAPQGDRQWHRVVDNLETSLDEAKSRLNVAEIETQRFEEKLAAYLAQREGADEEPVVERITLTPANDIDAPWPAPMSLEEASVLREQLDSGTIQDTVVEARLELSNQLGEAYEKDESGKVPRRQLALRAAIEKINQGHYDKMTYDEIKLVLACRKLLTSRLEPKPRDERLKRIIDGASRVLLRRKEALEAEFKRNEGTPN